MLEPQKVGCTLRWTMTYDASPSPLSAVLRFSSPLLALCPSNLKHQIRMVLRSWKSNWKTLYIWWKCPGMPQRYSKVMQARGDFIQRHLFWVCALSSTLPHGLLHLLHCINLPESSCQRDRLWSTHWQPSSTLMSALCLQHEPNSERIWIGRCLLSGNKLYPGSSGKSKYYYYDDYYYDYDNYYDYDYDYALQRGVGCLQTFSLLRWFHNTQGWQGAQRPMPVASRTFPSKVCCTMVGSHFSGSPARSLLLSPTMNAAMHGLKVWNLLGYI
jgi:hypothetical protein